MSHPWYSIRTLTPVAAAAAGIVAAAAAEVWIYGDIGESYYEETVAAKDFVREIRALDVEAMTVRIASIGGSVPDGLLMYNALREHKATIHISIDSVALSIASLVATAGDTVAMVENGVYMMHAPWTGVYGNASQLRATAAQLDVWAAAMATSYATKSGKTLDEIKALLADGTDHYYTAEEAKAAGFVDQLIPAFPVAASALKPDAVLHRYPSAAGRLSAFIPAAPAARNSNQEPNPMDPKNPQAGGNNPAPTPATPSAADILAMDKARREGVRSQFGLVSARVTDQVAFAKLQQECEDDHAITPEAAGGKVLAFLAKDATPVAGGSVHITEDETDKRKVAVSAALMVRAGVATPETRKIAMASAYRGHTLLDLAKESLVRAGVRHDHMDKMQIVAAAFTSSTSDFPVLLENAMHKTLLTAYQTVPDTWSRFCHIGTVSDFRDHNRYRTGSLGILDDLEENGEFKAKVLPDGEKAKIRAKTKGNIIPLSREMIVNDDLNAFVGVSRDMGRAARRTIEVVVYQRLAENGGMGPLMEDGKPLFHADHKNIATGSVLGVEGLDGDRVVMASQTDLSGNEFLDLRPAVLLVPLALGGTARVINKAEYDPDTPNKMQKPNKVAGLFSDIVDTPRLSGARRYLFADHMEAPVMEVAFLDGNQEPFLEQQQGFNVDGALFKVRHDFGVAAIDFRGAVTNAGAA